MTGGRCLNLHELSFKGWAGHGSSDPAIRPRCCPSNAWHIERVEADAAAPLADKTGVVTGQQMPIGNTPEPAA
jgi:hypothetical protein